MFNVAVEAVFPQCAIIRLSDRQLKNNEKLLSDLRRGEAYKGDGWGLVRGGVWLTAGSRAEGLAIENGWGHPVVDRDIMQLYGGHLGVHVPRSLPPPGRALLKYRPEDCPPAYCKIEVTDEVRLTEVEVGGMRLGAACVDRSEGLDWLKTDEMLMRIEGEDTRGPAGQDGESEFVPTLVCNTAHPVIDREYVHRHHHRWIEPQELEMMRQLPMLLVLIGHRDYNEFPFQARLSWSHLEMALIIKLPLQIKQIYIAFKYIYKSLANTLRGSKAGDGGRRRVGSYHLKTVFLHFLEKGTRIFKWCQSRVLLALIRLLQSYVEADNLPHYFLPDCNLLNTVGPKERLITRNVINYILSDPLRSILMCPTVPLIKDPVIPYEIYGKFPRHIFLSTFRHASSQSTYASYRERLLFLLNHLDERRREQYRRQETVDGKKGVKGRTELTGLVDMLLREKKTVTRGSF